MAVTVVPLALASCILYGRSITNATDAVTAVVFVDVEIIVGHFVRRAFVQFVSQLVSATSASANFFTI